MNPLSDSWDKYRELNIPVEISEGVLDASDETSVAVAEIHFKMGFVAAVAMMAQVSQMSEELNDKVAQSAANDVHKFLESDYAQICMSIATSRWIRRQTERIGESVPPGTGEYDRNPGAIHGTDL